jgi:hypothetical protein
MKKSINKFLSLAMLFVIAITAIADAQNVNAPPGQTTNVVPKWNPGFAWTLTNSQIFDNGTNVGIGLAAPQNLLHQHVAINNFNLHQFTNLTTGNTFTDGFKIGVDPTVTATNPFGLQAALLMHQEGAPIQFWTIDQNANLPNSPATLVNRAEFTSGGQMPNSLPLTGNEDGFRIWNPGYNSSGGAYLPFSALDLWTGAGSTTHIRFDGSGIVEGQNSRFEMTGNYNGLWFTARQTWLNPPTNTIPSTPRIIFNMNNTMVAANNAEVARFSNNGVANQLGYMRIGLQPVPLTPVDAFRRLEVFDNAANVFQFRITQNQGTRFTDFRTTAIGDLEIFPSGTSPVTPGGVGINIAAPGNTLEINSNAPGIGPLNSGLKFTDLNSSSGTTANPGQGILSVDLSGNVIYVPDGTGFGTCLAPTVLSSDEARNLNHQSIYFLDPANPTTTQKNDVRIGWPCNSPLGAKFDVLCQTAASPVGYNFTHRFAGRFWETGTYYSSGADELVGVAGISDVLHTYDDRSTNLGGDFAASNATHTNIGGRGTTTIPALGYNPAVFNIGLWGEVLNPAQ